MPGHKDNNMLDQNKLAGQPAPPRPPEREERSVDVATVVQTVARR